MTKPTTLHDWTIRKDHNIRLAGKTEKGVAISGNLIGKFGLARYHPVVVTDEQIKFRLGNPSSVSIPAKNHPVIALLPQLNPNVITHKSWARHIRYNIAIQGIPCQALCVFGRSEPDVGITSDYIYDLAIFDLDGYYAEWLQKIVEQNEAVEDKLYNEIFSQRYDDRVAAEEARADAMQEEKWLRDREEEEFMRKTGEKV